MGLQEPPENLAWIPAESLNGAGAQWFMPLNVDLGSVTDHVTGHVTYPLFMKGIIVMTTL